MNLLYKPPVLQYVHEIIKCLCQKLNLEANMLPKLSPTQHTFCKGVVFQILLRITVT